MKRNWTLMVVVSALMFAGCGQMEEEVEQHQVDGKQWVEVRRVGDETHLIAKTIEEKGGGIVVEIVELGDPILVVDKHPEVSVEEGGVVVLTWDEENIERYKWSDLKKKQVEEMMNNLEPPKVTSEILEVVGKEKGEQGNEPEE